jgi:hypothetical protein
MNIKKKSKKQASLPFSHNKENIAAVLIKGIAQ